MAFITPTSTSHTPTSTSSSPASTRSNPNIFTPPPSCLGEGLLTVEVNSDLETYVTTTESRVSDNILSESRVSDNILLKGFHALDTNCYPQFFGWSTGIRSDGSVSIGSQNILSPATCPSGYTNAAERSSGAETIGTCCPAVLTHTIISSNPAAESFSSWGLENTRDISDWACGTETYYTWDVSKYGTIYAPQIVVTWQAKDLSLFGVTTTTTSSTALVTSTPSAAASTPTISTTPSPGLSTGAKAGIAVGIILGVLLVIKLVVGLIWWRRRRSRKTAPNNQVEVMVEHPNSKPAKMGNRAVRAEIDG